jgi:hypothetical protein
VREILLAALGVLGVAIPSVIQLMTGESRRISNMRSTVQLLTDLPDDPELDPTRVWLKKALAREAHLDRDTGSHRPFMIWGAAIIAVCLVFTFLVMQPPSDGQLESQLRSVFILLAVVSYVVGAAVFVHGVHLLGRRYHMFSASEADKS